MIDDPGGLTPGLISLSLDLGTTTHSREWSERHDLKSEAVEEPVHVDDADPVFPKVGMVRGARVVKLLRQIFGQQAIENLPLPFAAVAVDIGPGTEVVLGSTVRNRWRQPGTRRDASY